MKRQSEVENAMVLSPPRATRKRNVHCVTREEAEKAAYSATEDRLINMSLVRARVEDQKEELAELENLGVEALRHRSASFVSKLRPGMRVDPEEAHAAQMAYLRGCISRDERELVKLSLAMECLRGDQYFAVLELKYTRNLSDQDIAERLCCDKATVCRHRRQLIKKLAVRLYGSF